MLRLMKRYVKLALYQALIQNFARKVADGVATHSKPYWCKGGGWLILVDISYTTLHKRTSEVGWLATLSIPPGSAPAYPGLSLGTRLYIKLDIFKLSSIVFAYAFRSLEIL